MYNRYLSDTTSNCIFSKFRLKSKEKFERLFLKTSDEFSCSNYQVWDKRNSYLGKMSVIFAFTWYIVTNRRLFNSLESELKSLILSALKYKKSEAEALGVYTLSSAFDNVHASIDITSEQNAYMRGYLKQRGLVV